MTHDFVVIVLVSKVAKFGAFFSTVGSSEHAHVNYRCIHGACTYGHDTVRVERKLGRIPLLWGCSAQARERFRIRFRAVQLCLVRIRRASDREID